MARVKLNKKYEQYTGTLPPNGSRFYLTQRYGETLVSHYPLHRDPDSITPNQRASIVEFAQVRAIADAELADPVKHEQWLQKWHSSLASEGKRYKTLRGFTIAQVRAQLTAGR